MAEQDKAIRRKQVKITIEVVMEGYSISPKSCFWKEVFGKDAMKYICEECLRFNDFRRFEPRDEFPQKFSFWEEKIPKNIFGKTFWEKSGV